MKQIKLLFLLLLLILGCDHESLAPESASAVKLRSEEYFINDPAVSGSTDDFARLYKKRYHYEQDKLTRIDAYDFNPTTHAYDLGYTLEEYHYTTEGNLSQRIQFIGTSGLRWINEYEYTSDTRTKVMRYESTNNEVKILQDWWIMESTPSSQVVKYYQGNNELYAQLNYGISEAGNIISVTSEPPFPLGGIHYEYDNSPNPYKFPELSGEYGFDAEKYLSENNVITVTNDSNNKLTRIIEYDSKGYPISITTSTSKRVLKYH